MLHVEKGKVWRLNFGDVNMISHAQLWFELPGFITLAAHMHTTDRLYYVCLKLVYKISEEYTPYTKVPSNGRNKFWGLG